MRLYALLTAVSCAALLAGCSRKPKSPVEIALTADPALATAISSLPVGTPTTSAPEKVTGHGKASGGGTSGGGGAAATTSVAWSRTGSPTKGDLVPLSESTASDIWLSATAPSGQSNDAVFIPIAPSIDTASTGSLVFRTAAIGIGGSAIGLGALLDVGSWGGGSSAYTGFSQVFPQSFGFGFEGYHQGFSQADPKAWAPEGSPSGLPPSSWNLPSSFYNGGDHPSGGPGGDPHNGSGSNDGPGDNHNDDHHGNYDGKGPQGTSTPVTATPEPGTVVLLATGFLALVPVVRRRRRA